MPFALDNTHISGGSFNNVSGNMTQVFNSQAINVNGPVDQQLLKGSHEARDRGINGSTGVIRGSRGHSDFRPYDIANRGNRCRPEILPNLIGNFSNNGQAGVQTAMHYLGPTDIGDGAMSIPDLKTGRFQCLPEFTSPRYVGSEPPLPDFPHNPLRTFNSVAGNMTQLNVTSHGESGLDILCRRVVVEALHDSGERFPEPACRPGTRTAVLDQLNTWSLPDFDAKSPVMWLNGSAGIGKSAIAQMFASECQTQGRLGASFFFKRGHQKRGTWDGLFTTIAYQLATAIPGLSLPIQQAVEADKLMRGRAMPLQFRRLILEPLQQTAPLEFFPIIVVDGLDECDDCRIQQQILCLFIDAIQEKRLPIHLLICSRPEPHLRERLDTEQTLAICGFSFGTNSPRSILNTKAEEYLLEIPGLPPTHLSIWLKSPPAFSSMQPVIRFVGDEYSHPADRLDRILSLDPQSTAPLDDFYTEILSLVPQSSQNLQILHVIWKGKGLLLHVDPEEIDALLTLRPGTTCLMLRALHSIFDVPPVRGRPGYRNPVEVLHASLGDYLGDARRSESLVELMRNETFQNSLFLSNGLFDWPQRGSSYPSDLIELWEDHRSVSRLAQDLDPSYGEQTKNCGASTLKFDSIYAEILPKNPDLFSVLTAMALGMSLEDVLEVLGLRFSVLRPFIEVRQLLVLPLPVGDSPVDFLSDPSRSGELWNEQNSADAEEMVLRWIAFTKRDGWLDGKFLMLLDRCGPNPKILQGLDTLNLSALCNGLSKDDHLWFHKSDVHPTYLLRVVNWLRRLPDPPMNVIRVCEEQILSIMLCRNARRRDFGWDSDEDSAEVSDEDSDNEVCEEGEQE
ncbi:hypothetical protein DFH09DRAFT_1410996 [Mycena vulgaris]|nr:hypothetical protein DFH09DRAFT_1410996 [Mycena vulgaris]